MEIKGIQVHSCSSAHHTAPSSNVLKEDETAWNAGCHPPAWITLELKEDVEIDRIMLLPEMTPKRADVVHEVRAGLSFQNMHAIERFSGTAQSGVWITLDLPKIYCRYVEIKTLSSPSWVSWRQIRIFGLELQEQKRLHALETAALQGRVEAAEAKVLELQREARENAAAAGQARE
jgi:hypothetical protein